MRLVYRRTMRPTLRFVAALAAVAALLAVLAACSGGSKSASSGSAAGVGTLKPGEASTFGAANGASAPAAVPTTARDAAGSSAKALDLTDAQALIRTGSLTVQVKHGVNVSQQADKAGGIATAAGGQVYGDDRTSGDNATASLTLMVPPAAVASVLDQLAALGIEQSRQVSTQDVTQQVADVNSRVKSARAAVATLTALYQHATKISDIIAIETQLSQRESDLEALEAQQRTLAAQTALATIHLYLSGESQLPAATKPSQRGFVAGLKAGWRHFTAATVAVATALGAALPFLLLLVVLAAAVRLILKRRRVAVVAPQPVDHTD
jgi:Domain of unknown function (DUF4349)